MIVAQYMGTWKYHYAILLVYIFEDFQIKGFLWNDLLLILIAYR